MAAIKTFNPGTGERCYVQALQIWMVLTAHVMMKRNGQRTPVTMTYGELAKYMGYATPQAGHTLGRALGVVGYLCLDNGLPALNCLVVDQESGQPGAGAVRRPNKTADEEQMESWKTDWFRFRPPSTGTLRDTYEAH